ncbi:hypothetical protein F5Y15DRAFT_419861 [Xylariaceae sp. FL0016]|nr:hypothetical protein F5Y15DRAFT_419861 [Xylariaceae sp. FL0016]
MPAVQVAGRLRSPGLTAARQFTRSIQSTTSPRLSSQKGDWGRIFKARGQTLAIYVPGLGLILGWPLLAKEALDGHM